MAEDHPETAASTGHNGRSSTSGNPTTVPRGGVRLNQIAESWEDEDLSSEEEQDSDAETTITAPPSSSPAASSYVGSQVPPHHGIRAPPPTPNVSRQSSCRSTTSTASHSSSTYGKRPEKQAAVANRMIASALGIRSTRTEAQKAYDRTMLANEKKRREQEKIAEEKRKADAEKAKAAIWES
ncbi:uncharacterized protein GIQ15_05491 [Arthroderma uncinatum]|uniref:uncharacterized protein n=1 Tax=Arthroderma uncinatum TaxID=74035 RepID=UPI00144A9499|nr:uncharacterized protein GIQ15_05491 [Arthroderma uncinatum]KAF3480144.1 hypothetical protein GIQ15_05491 [Arthroderma uncinatum]